MAEASSRMFAAKIAISVAIYFLAVAAVPIYNKKVFSGDVCWSGSCAKQFPYPIATAFAQLGFVCILCTAGSVLGHLCSRSGSSWIFGPHFGYKLKHIAPCGLLFGLKYGITNWGLALVPTAKHLLLQSTDLVWTVIFARIINKERMGLFEYIAVMLSVSGAIFISLAAGGELEAPALGLIVNWLTPIFLALCITTLRKGTAEVLRPDNCLGGKISAMEITAIKLALSSSVALLLAFVLENSTILELEKGKKHVDSFWVALSNYPVESLGLMLAGGIFVLIFQVNITWLCGLTSATAVGIVGEVKVLPQWLFNALFNFNTVDFTGYNIAGALLSLLGSVLYATSSSSTRRLEISREGLQWRPRSSMEEKLMASSSISGQESPLHAGDP